MRGVSVLRRHPGGSLASAWGSRLMRRRARPGCCLRRHSEALTKDGTTPVRGPADPVQCVRLSIHTALRLGVLRARARR